MERRGEKAQRKWSLRVMPTSSPASTMGGWMAQGGAGLSSLEYGAFIDNVISAEVILVDGIIKEFSGDELDNLYGSYGCFSVPFKMDVECRKKLKNEYALKRN